MNERLQSLFNKYVNGMADEEEQKELSELVDHADTLELSTLLKNEWENHEETTSILSDRDAGLILQKILKPPVQTAVEVPFYRKSWLRIAASVLLLLGIFAIYKLSADNATVQQQSTAATIQNDIAPGGNKATLTLADGTTILLDSAANGNLASQGNIKVIKLDGQLSYSSASTGVSNEVLYNTITTPRGGQYQLILADGSKVWLNAASSLRFPASFSGSERKVELNGEGYFEVAKNAAMPFKVDVAGRGEIKVLGTHFNVNAYEDEPYINTALLEGSIRFSVLSPGLPVEAKTLLPGEQVKLTADGKMTLSDGDVQQAIAWKTGIFNFSNADLQTVLRQLARWYNVDVKFEGQVPERTFSGKMQMNLNLSQVLRLLENNNVRFKIQADATGNGASQLVVTK